MTTDTSTGTFGVCMLLYSILHYHGRDIGTASGETAVLTQVEAQAKQAIPEGTQEVSTNGYSRQTQNPKTL